MTWRVGVDTGGTFIDVALVEESHDVVGICKVPSNRQDPSTAILDGITRLLTEHNLQASKIDYLGHGTTVATNAVLENTVAAVGLLTTRGFRDVMEIARQRRPDLYDLDVAKPDPVVSRQRRLEVDERLDADGSVAVPLDEVQAGELLAWLRDDGVESLAVCLLHSYLDPANERRIRELAGEVAPGLPVSLSSEVHPEFREYARFSTTIMNAALVPVMSRYLNRLSSAVEELGVRSQVHVIQSNGGVMSAAAAGASPVSTLFSGPSAGVLGASRVARAAGEDNIITVDMGGTSTDVCLISDGRVPVVHERHIAGKPVLGAMVDVHSVGSGGGSIAWVDDGGLLKVGPRSAGAQPGPACYGNGGDEPTVTDANAALAHLHPDAPLAGNLRIDVDAARKALHDRLGQRLGLGVEETAAGVLRVLQASLMRAVRMISVERGSDPRDFTLVPYGGAGALHAAHLARQLGIRRILVPPAPGILCAYGVLAADLRADFSATCLTVGDADGVDTVRVAFDRLRQRAADWLTGEDVEITDARLEPSLEMRYARQNYQLTVAVDGEIDDAVLQDAVARFHELHEARYGYAIVGEPVWVVTVRLTATVPSGEFAPASPPSAGSWSAGPTTRQVFVEEQGGFIDCAVFDRHRLRPGQREHGPGIVQQTDATTVVLAGQSFQADELGNLVIEEAAR